MEYLVCVDQNYQACQALQQAPPLEPTTLQPTAELNTFAIPGLGMDKIQLGVTITPGAPTPVFVQNFFIECDGLHTIGQYEYCVDGDTGKVRFGSPPAIPIAAQFRRLSVSQRIGLVQEAPPSGFGSALGPVQAPLKTVCDNNPREHSLPCDVVTGLPLSTTMTIREWGLGHYPYNPVASSNILHRYGLDFSGFDLFKLLMRDPSFDVQAQWFAAASYGLMQLIPEDLRDRITRLVPAAEQPRLWALYDPMSQNPTEKLFDPTICVRLGALEDVLLPVNPEMQDAGCSSKPNQCSWERLWRRRLCVFNTGGQHGDGGTCDYATDVFSRIGDYLPQP